MGGGTAGLAIAARLAQDPSQSVAVIEAGGFYQIDNGNDSIIPAYCYKSANATSLELTNSLIDWMYTTEPQSQLNDRTFHFVRGKTLGGTSARNYLNYNRGWLLVSHGYIFKLTPSSHGRSHAEVGWRS